MQTLANTAIIVPSLNPDEKLMLVVEGLVSRGFHDIIVVNDGSTPQTAHYFDAVAALPECTVLTHETNRGKGRALKTAFSYILAHRPDCTGAITVDGDNQHHPDDVAALADAQLKNPSALILGVRNFSQQGVPLRSRLGNGLTAFIFRLVCRCRLTDTQTGLRAVPRSMLPDLIDLQGERFEYETNMLLAASRNHHPIREVTIKTIYIDENATSHFRAVADSLSILRLIAAFCAASIACAGLDIGCYWLAVHLLAALPLHRRIFFATLVSRAISSMANYLLNRHAVFGARCSHTQALPRYYFLCVCQFFCSWAGVWGLTRIIGGSSVLAKLIVDGILFSISFNIQRRWVFSAGSKTCNGGKASNG